MTIIDTRSTNRNYPVPAAGNLISDEFPRLITALTMIDSDVASIFTSLAGKAAIVHTHNISDVINLQSMLDGKVASGTTYSLAGLSDVSGAAGATSAQVLKRVGSAWQPGFVQWTEIQGAPSTTTVFGGSGSSHSLGLVPDPGSTAGTAKVLRENATWSAVSSSDVSAALGYTPLSGISGSMVTSALGYTPLSAVSWSIVSGKPTTLAGYGITDALAKGGGATTGTVTFDNTVGSGTQPGTGVGTFAAISTGGYGGGYGLVDGGFNIGLWSNAGALKVGFGTSLGALTDKFTITPIGNVDIYGSADMHYQILSSSGSAWFVGNSPGGMILHNATNTDTVLSTNATERMRIRASGDLVIGSYRTDTPGIEFGSQNTVSNPYFDWHSSGSGIDYDVRIQATGGNSGSAGQGALNITAGSLNWYGNSSLASISHGSLYIENDDGSQQASITLNQNVNSNRSVLTFQRQGTTVHEVSVDAGMVYIDVNVGSYAWYFSGSQKAYIDSGGNLSVAGTIYSGGVAVIKGDMNYNNVGSYAAAWSNSFTTGSAPGTTVAGSSLNINSHNATTYSTLPGTWRFLGSTINSGNCGLFQRIA